MFQQYAGNIGTAELRALIGVEIIRRAVMTDRLGQSFNAEFGLPADRRVPGQPASSKPPWLHRHKVALAKTPPSRT